MGRRRRGPDPCAGRVLEAQSVGAVRTALPRRAVLAARFLPRWCRWFLSPLSPCAGSKDASGHCYADVFTAKGCGQQGAGAARALLPHRAVRALASRALLPHRAVRALVPLFERTLALRQATMTHGGISVSRPGPSSWGEKGQDDSTGTLLPAFRAPGKVGVRCPANVCPCSRVKIPVGGACVPRLTSCIMAVGCNGRHVRLSGCRRRRSGRHDQARPRGGD